MYNSQQYKWDTWKSVLINMIDSMTSESHTPREIKKVFSSVLAVECHVRDPNYGIIF